jgi:hypothetical protein
MGYYATLFPDEGTMYANYTVYQGTKSIGLLLPSTLLCCSTTRVRSKEKIYELGYQ